MLIAALIALLGAAFGGGVVADRRLRRPRRAHGTTAGGRILLPFAGTSISRRSLEAAVRLARAEHATLMPTFLARVPRHLPLDAALPEQCTRCMPLLEAIEQRALAEGVAVDSRISRGRTYRDALRHQLAEERIDRIIVSATTDERTGLNAADLRWLLSEVPSEVVILRPAFDDASCSVRTASALGRTGRRFLDRHGEDDVLAVDGDERVV